MMMMMIIIMMMTMMKIIIMMMMMMMGIMRRKRGCWGVSRNEDFGAFGSFVGFFGKAMGFSFFFFLMRFEVIV